MRPLRADRDISKTITESRFGAELWQAFLGAAIALLIGMSANAVAARQLARRILPEVALARSVRASTLFCAGCLALGFALGPLVGEPAAALGAVVVFSGIALVMERERARALWRWQMGGMPPA